MTVKDVYDFLDFIAPFETQCEWDNCGLSVGSMDKEVNKIYLALDVTSQVIEDAKAFGADLVVTHHPLIFNPVTAVKESSVLYKAVASGMSFLSSHTCLDKALGGVNDCLARVLGIKNIKTSHIDGCLKIGEVNEILPSDFAENLKNTLGGGVAFTDCGKPIKKIAFCSGGGGDFITAASELGADALLTGEAKHHEFLASGEMGVSLFAAGHYETERVVLPYLKRLLGMKFGENIEVVISGLEAPVKYI